jgi:hypothetical protein
MRQYTAAAQTISSRHASGAEYVCGSPVSATALQPKAGVRRSQALMILPSTGGVILAGVTGGRLASRTGCHNSPVVGDLLAACLHLAVLAWGAQVRGEFIGRRHARRARPGSRASAISDVGRSCHTQLRDYITSCF